MSDPASAAEGVSVIVPVFDEVESLESLHARLRDVLDRIDRPSGIVFVDDGSTDGSTELLERLAGTDPAVRVVVLARNFGQTAALSAGIEAARHAILVTLDADLQNDPADIPRLLEEIDRGADVVSGWRRARRDSFVLRTLPSVSANALVRALTGVRLHDFGCTLKAYRSHLFRTFRLYGEMHRFVPAYCARAGGRVVEVEVAHAPRRAGRSKYGLGRTWRVILDLITLKFLLDFGTKPLHVFGSVGFVACILGCVAGATTLVQRYLDATAFVHRNPLILLAVFLFLLGMQCIMLGLLAEIGMRTYHETRGMPPYVVSRVSGGEAARGAAGPGEPAAAGSPRVERGAGSS